MADEREQGEQGGEQVRQPPKDTRFKPGQSGNPAGRPPGRPNPKKSAGAALDRAVELAGRADAMDDAWLRKLKPEVRALIEGEDGLTTWLFRAALENRRDVLAMYRARIPRQVAGGASDEWRETMVQVYAKQLEVAAQRRQRLEQGGGVLEAEVLEVTAPGETPSRARVAQAARAIAEAVVDDALAEPTDDIEPGPGEEPAPPMDDDELDAVIARYRSEVGAEGGPGDP